MLHRPSTTPDRNHDLATIHATARKLGMSEFQRRAVQYDVTGKESCLLMSAAERQAVISELERTRIQPRPVEYVSDAEAQSILDGAW